MSKMNGIFLEVEKTLIDQIEKLNDDSLFEDPEAAKQVVERSKAISSLANNYMQMQEFKLNLVKTCESTGPIYNGVLGIE